MKLGIHESSFLNVFQRLRLIHLFLKIIYFVIYPYAAHNGWMESKPEPHEPNHVFHATLETFTYICMCNVYEVCDVCVCDCFQE